MARPREFDTNDALTRAMHLFWLKGYHDTTTRDLDTRLGIGHQSLYNAFGDKASLFRSVLTHYVQKELKPRLATIEHENASKKDIVRFVAQMVDFYDTDPPRKGCLLLNVAVQRIHDDIEVAGIVSSYVDRLSNDFGTALENSLLRKEIQPGTDVKLTSRGLICAVMGLGVASRAGYRREFLVDMASMALRPLY